MDKWLLVGNSIIAKYHLYYLMRGCFKGFTKDK